ncbi:MAG: hypothetical protein AAFQ83_03650 [Bacteroidota bacterium]
MIRTLHIISLGLCFLLLLLCTPLKGQNQMTEDVIYLKNGSIIRGQIIDQKLHESVTILLVDGSVLNFETGEILRVQVETKAYLYKKLTYRSRQLAYKYYKPSKQYINLDIGIAFNQARFGPQLVFHSHIHAGIRFRERLYLGVGTGYDPYDRGTAYPAFVVAKGTILNKPIAPIYQVKLGYAYAGGTRWNSTVFNPGPMGMAAVGLRIMNRNQSLFEFVVGYKGQWTYQEYTEFQFSPMGLEEQILVTGTRLYQNIVWQVIFNLSS